MTKEEAVQIESSQRQHHEVLEHQNRMDYAVTLAEYARFSIIKPKIYKDGDSWCCLLGEDLQTGISGFGKTPHEAIVNWDSAFNCEEKLAVDKCERVKCPKCDSIELEYTRVECQDCGHEYGCNTSPVT